MKLLSSLNQFHISGSFCENAPANSTLILAKAEIIWLSFNYMRGEAETGAVLNMPLSFLPEV